MTLVTSLMRWQHLVTEVTGIEVTFILRRFYFQMLAVSRKSLLTETYLQLIIVNMTFAYPEDVDDSIIGNRQK